MAVDASYRAAPIVADAVRTIGYANAVDLIRGGPTRLGVPAPGDGRCADRRDGAEVGQALRVAQDPLIGSSSPASRASTSAASRRRSRSRSTTRSGARSARGGGDPRRPAGDARSGADRGVRAGARY
jgi:hypothetical protein